MSYTADGHNRAKSKMLSDFNQAIPDAAELREAAAEIPSDGSAAAQTRPEENAGGATAGLSGASQAAVRAAAETAAAADDGVQDKP